MTTSLSTLIPLLDRSNMLDLILHFHDQVSDAIKIGRKADLPRPTQPISQIVVAGMGGSAIGGNILQQLFAVSGSLPCSVCRDYRLPGWVNRNTLVVLSSFSGNTEETLAAFASAVDRGCVCLVCSSGGKLLELAKRHQQSVIQIPGGRPPRTALGYLLLPLVVTFIAWGWLKSSLLDVEELRELLVTMAQKHDPTQEENRSQSVQIAQACQNRVPVFYAAAEMEAVAMRWKGQFCENSKVLAYHNTLPEMNHNEIVGWQRAAAMNLNQQLAVFFLRDRDDHPRVQKRMEIVKGLIALSRTPVLEIFSQGETLLSRLLSLIYLADFASFDLALLNGEDPTPIKNIDYLKASLANDKN